MLTFIQILWTVRALIVHILAKFLLSSSISVIKVLFIAHENSVHAQLTHMKKSLKIELRSRILKCIYCNAAMHMLKAVIINRISLLFFNIYKSLFLLLILFVPCLNITDFSNVVWKIRFKCNSLLLACFIVRNIHIAILFSLNVNSV